MPFSFTCQFKPFGLAALVVKLTQSEIFNKHFTLHFIRVSLDYYPFLACMDDLNTSQLKTKKTQTDTSWLGLY